MKVKIGIRPVIDGRWGGVRESLEKQTMDMAKNAAALIEQTVFYSDGTPAEVVICPHTIGGGKEAASCEEFFSAQNVCATLSVTPCWCYGSETMDLNPLTVKAVWGFNGTERPGAVYLAAAMAAHAQRNLPAFAIYGRDVQDASMSGITPDVAQKLTAFAKCALAVGQMRNKAYVSIGGVSMGIGGSFLDPQLMQDYFNIRGEWVDMTEVLRRIDLEIYDASELEKQLKWIKEKCREGRDLNEKEWGMGALPREQMDGHWEFVAKMTLVIRDIMQGNEKLNDLGRHEEALGRNAVLGGFQGQRMWTDYKPNGDYTEAVLTSSFDWNGKKEPVALATENDNCNGLAMLFAKLLTGSASVFADVRTYWSSSAVQRVTGWQPEGLAAQGFIHLINSGAAALDGTGVCKDKDGNSVIKKWWEVEQPDIDAMLENTQWMPANRGYFRGGGFSSSFSTQGSMPVTLIRLNMVAGIGYTMQIAEGHTVELPQNVNQALLARTDPTWPSTWFVPLTDEKDTAFCDVYSVMANWGSNHGAFAYGHIGDKLITLASMLRIPVSMHNVNDGRIYRPHSWSAFGTKDKESADYRACAHYGPLYR